VSLGVDRISFIFFFSYRWLGDDLLATLLASWLKNEIERKYIIAMLLELV
jgi:hypothetical protein